MIIFFANLQLSVWRVFLLCLCAEWERKKKKKKKIKAEEGWLAFFLMTGHELYNILAVVGEEEMLLNPVCQWSQLDPVEQQQSVCTIF